ncbi:hypothetical protein [uncultured Cohaesibacter sp.]|uniref:hypothetical protein n=1 Tax=uncultured Cohaesibacter sp. TaxID=1002546 RepID=UPI00292D2889|nr:hypothetical protein [uncultured Cohaesibacter sp.]
MASQRPFSFLIIASLSALIWVAAIPTGHAAPPRGFGPPGTNDSQRPPEAAMQAPSLPPEQMVMAQNKNSGPSAGNAASIRPKPKPSKCLALAREIGASRVWWGRHVGAKEVESDDLFFTFRARKVEFDDIGCFRSRKDCENWLYWKRTEYPLFSSISPCRKGL